MLSDTLKERIAQLISYYHYHGIEDMIKKHPGFVADDFGKLLADLEQEILADN